jgi:zinc protease
MAPVATLARLDLAAATVERLDNGLTVIVLEEPAFPVVSVQMLYRVGAKHEPLGATGLAHFLEHMAFRATENFPDTDVVNSIYAAGGEWHGYTWLEQTTYFATAPRGELDLLLRIEADRMARLLIPKDDIEAEIGAVLSEMHGYENDPASVLHDNVLYLSFLAHPYRNNSIGWESDIAGIRHDEVVDFYRQHYHPGNAVLAIVGDVRSSDALVRVRRLFGSLAGRAPTPDPRTVEPPQRGVRHVRLNGAVDRKHFKIAWRAPSVRSPDFAPFLVLQELLAGGSGVNFLQNDWGTPARAESPLGAIAAEVATWYPPAAQDYVFMVSGSIPAGADEAAVEAGVQRVLGAFDARLGAATTASDQLLGTARQAVLRELTHDVLTTEDAAHQLAYFSGLGALEVLTGLPERIASVEAGDVQRVLRSYLGPAQRTIGWYVPGEEAETASSAPATAAAPPAVEGEAGANVELAVGVDALVAKVPAGAPTGPAPAATVHRLRNGTPVILQPSALSPTLQLKVVLPGAVALPGAESRPGQPVPGVTSLDWQLLPHELEATLVILQKSLKSRAIDSLSGDGAVSDPGSQLEAHFRDILGLSADTSSAQQPLSPLLIVLSGDIDARQAHELLESAFGQLPSAAQLQPPALNSTSPLALESAFERPIAQEQLGYVVRAPGPRDGAAAAWWMTLYILSHGYEGRLGKEAISRRGLVYYIDSAYHSNGRHGWVTLTTGVDPAKLPAMRGLLRSELGRLQREPPSQAEIDEARRHLLGRRISAAQSNQELADRLAREWFWYGRLRDYASLDSDLSAVTRQDVLAILPEFAAGAVVAVRNRQR